MRFCGRIEWMPNLLTNLIAVSLLASSILIGQHAFHSEMGWLLQSHIVLAVFTFSLLCVASVQALLLATVERRVRLRPESRLLSIMPPIESMEQVLFQPWFKTVFAIAAWSVLMTLLLGRYALGWRGKKALYSTLAGFILLVVAYICGKLIAII